MVIVLSHMMRFSFPYAGEGVDGDSAENDRKFGRKGDDSLLTLLSSFNCSPIHHNSFTPLLLP